MSTGWSFRGCPQPPGWKLDWERIVTMYPAIAGLASCPQNPLYHGEGDVLTHTRRVCEILAGDADWRQMPPEERSVLFAAALFHDLGKASCTEDTDGMVQSPGHPAKGARLAQNLLYRETQAPAPPLHLREQICRLIGYHGLPLSWDRRKDPRRSAIEGTLTLPGSWLALLGKADAHGRVSGDSDALLTSIELFKELCSELGCLESPMEFPDDFTRFMYLNGERDTPEIKVYDHTAFEVIVLSGLPGAGKDTWITAHGRGLETVSLDRWRQKLEVKPTDNQGAVIQAAREEARHYMRRSQPFIWNATNVTRSLRSSIIRLILPYGGRVRLIYIESTYKELLLRNRARINPVPETILERLIAQLDVPSPSEAHHVEWLSS